jgi:hypothetical protein
MAMLPIAPSGEQSRQLDFVPSRAELSILLRAETPAYGASASGARGAHFSNERAVETATLVARIANHVRC